MSDHNEEVKAGEGISKASGLIVKPSDKKAIRFYEVDNTAKLYKTYQEAHSAIKKYNKENGTSHSQVNVYEFSLADAKDILFRVFNEDVDNRFGSLLDATSKTPIKL